MTAPLPPLPNLPESLNELYSDERAEVRGFAKDYAKLAVREALERAAKESERVEWTDRKTPPYKRDREPSEIAVAIHAMIEEYK